MIRINLLEETRTLAKAKGGGGGGLGLPKLELAENVPVFMLAAGIGLAVFALIASGLYLQNRISGLNDRIAEAERERQRLEPILKQNEELQAKKVEMNRRIGIIQELKAKQDLPVVLMDQLSRGMADHMWLEDLSFAGELLTVRGKAQTPLAYSNFLRNLEESKYFLNVATGRVFTDKKSGLTNFTMTTTFRPPLPPGATPPPPPEAGTTKKKKGKK